MRLLRFVKIGAISLLVFSMAACTSWDSMNRRQKGAVTGAAVGGVAGAAISGGGILGTVGGAAVGGVIGDQIGKNQ